MHSVRKLCTPLYANICNCARVGQSPSRCHRSNATTQMAKGRWPVCEKNVNASESINVSETRCLTQRWASDVFGRSIRSEPDGFLSNDA